MRAGEKTVATVVLALMCIPVAVFANDIPSSTMYFHGTLTESGGTYSGVIPMIDEGAPNSGYDVYGLEGGTAWFGNDPGGGPVWTSQAIGADHDAWPTWTPDTPDWYQYSLSLYVDGGQQKWAVRNHPGAEEAYPWYDTGHWGSPLAARGVPMSGLMNWSAMYAAETDIGAYLPGTGTPEIPGGAAGQGGGAGAWDMDWSWGSEVVPLELPGFAVAITDLGGGQYDVVLTPAGPAEVWVDDDFTSATPGWGITHFDAIQDGVDAVVIGGTVHVAAGTYNERVTIDQSMELRGAQYGVDPTAVGARSNPAAESIITEAGLGTSNPDLLIEIANGVTDVTIDGFTLNGDQANTTADTSVIRCGGSAGTADDSTISNNIMDGMIAVLYKGGSGLLMDRNRVTANKNGVVCQPNTATGATISNNVFMLGTSPVGGEDAIHLSGTVDSHVIGNTASGFIDGKGVGGSGQTNLEVSGNTFTGNKDAVSFWGTTTFVDILGNDLSGNTRYGISIKGQDIAIEENDLSGNGDVGVNVAKHVLDTERVSLWHNDLGGNTNFGLQVDGAVTETVDAEENYWGTIGSPGVAAEVTGLADFDPWCNADFTVCTFTSLVTDTYVDDDWATGVNEGDDLGDGRIFGYNAFATIQEGVENVSGSTVHVADGLYIASNTLVNKSVTIIGESRDGVVIAPAAEDVGDGNSTFDGNYQHGLMIVADDVTIQDLTVDGAANNVANGGALPDHNNFRVGIQNYADGDDGYDNLTIHNVGVLHTRRRGIALWPATTGGHVVSGCIIEDVDVRNGIMSAAAPVTITGNTISKTGGAIGLFPSLPASSGLTLTVTDNTIVDNAATWSEYYGTNWPVVAIYYRNPNYDQTLICTGNTLTIGDGDEPEGFPGVTGMYIYNADEDSLIANNTIDSTGGTNNWGIYLGGCAGTTVQGNTFTMNDSDSGIYLGRGVGGKPVPNVITGNTFTSTSSTSSYISEGCALVQGDHGDLFWMVEDPLDTNNVIADNKITGFVRGILLHSEGLHDVDATISGNGITSCGVLAIDGDTLTQTVNASANYYGVTSPATVGALVAGDVDYTPWLAGGVDLSPGFAGDFSTLWVDDDSPQVGVKGLIQEAVDLVSGSTIHVSAGGYAETATLLPGREWTLAGAGRDAVTWTAPTDDSACVSCALSGQTGATDIEISGFTFNVRHAVTLLHGTGISIVRGSAGPLSLRIHDNRFIEDRSSGDNTHWGTSMWLCHNRYAARDPGGDAPVKIHDNIDETWGGMTMSNSQAYDVYDNVFDGCSDAIYNGHGCPDVTGQTFGDHHIYGNTFKNAVDSLHPGGLTPAIDWQYYGAGGGTHLPSVIENNVFEDNDTAVRFVTDTDMVYPAHEIKQNSFMNNGTAVIVGGAYASTLNAENNYWGDASGPEDTADDAGETTELGECTDAPEAEFNADGLGGRVIDTSTEVVDYCPWLNPRLYLEVNETCYTTDGGGDTVTVEIVAEDFLDTVVGGQFFLSYDSALTFVSVEPGDAPFTEELHEVVDTNAGTIDYGVGVPEGSSGCSGPNPLVMARITFTTAGEACDTEGLVAFRAPPAPFETRLTIVEPGGAAGPLVPDTLVDLTAITIDWTVPTITCPATVSVGTDAGECHATGVDLGTPVTDDNCGVADVSNDATEPFAVGDTTVTWTVTDTCGLTATCQQTVTVIDDEDPTITCPADVVVNADAGFCCATGVDLGTPTTDDNCGVASVSNDAPAQFPVGDTVVTWTVTDTSANTATCTQTVTVLGFNDFVVDVQLQGPMAAAVTRCITFTFYDCDGVDVPIDVNIAFDASGLGHGVITDQLPCGAYDCVSAQDTLHTLTVTLDASGPDFNIVAGQYVANFTGANLLEGGDFYDDTADAGVDFIDIVDFGVFVAEWGANYDSEPDGNTDGNTPCGVFLVHADQDGDGAIDMSDRAFITDNYMHVGDMNCCPPVPHVPLPRISITVREMRRLGVANAERADLNGDGVVNFRDITCFQNGQRPDVDSEKSHLEAPDVHSLRVGTRR